MMVRVYFLFLSTWALCSLLAANGAKQRDMSTALLIRVDQSGKGDYKKIQDAIDAVPSNNSQLIFIWIKPGTYRFISSNVYIYIYSTVIQVLT